MITDAMLPDIFAVLMALSILMYAILDGYDLGVGMLLPLDNQNQRDQMIASIGPFWDANETWLVLAVGIMLIAFPSAHSIVLGELYIPIVFLLIGLILRGVAFDFRAKVLQGRKYQWDVTFKVGSFLASASQGFMLGIYVVGFELSWATFGFALLSAIGVIAAYSLIGACWLIMKGENELQFRAIDWARKAFLFCTLGIAAVCLVNPLVNSLIMAKWFSGTGILLLALIPTLTFGTLIALWRQLYGERQDIVNKCARPFYLVLATFFLCFCGLAYSFYPWVIPGKLSIQESASASESLRFILTGALIVMPCIIAYTAFSYRVFRGKITDLRYY